MILNLKNDFNRENTCDIPISMMNSLSTLRRCKIVQTHRKKDHNRIVGQDEDGYELQPEEEFRPNEHEYEQPGGETEEQEYDQLGEPIEPVYEQDVRAIGQEERENEHPGGVIGQDEPIAQPPGTNNLHFGGNNPFL